MMKDQLKRADDRAKAAEKKVDVVFLFWFLFVVVSLPPRTGFVASNFTNFQEYFAEFFSSIMVACFSKSNHSISGEVHRRRPCLDRGEPEAAGGDGGEGEEEGGEVPGAHQAAHLQVK